MLLLLMLTADESQLEKILWLYDTYHDGMLRYARKLLSVCGNNNYMQDGEDVVQNAFMKITRSIDRIDTSLPENVIGGYMMRIVKNEVTDLINKRSPDLSPEDLMTVSEDCRYLEEFYDKSLYNRVISEIERMDPIYRDVMKLKFIEEKNIKEIAEILGVPEKTVYTRISRAIGALKKRFKDEVI